MANNLAGEKISEAEKVVHANGTITYEAEIGNTDYKFDSNGNFLNKDDENPNDKDEED